MNKEIRRKLQIVVNSRAFEHILFLLLSFFFVFPLLKQGVVFSGDDLRYHIERLNELYLNYMKGNIFPEFATFTFDKIGYPINIFYPWITIIPFVIVRLLIHNPVTSIYIGIAFYTFLTMEFAAWSFHKMRFSRAQCIITSVIYAFCAYRTIDIFARFALGEFLALTFLPIILYGFYSILFGNYREWIYLGLGMSLVLLSHVLSTFLFCSFLLFIFILFFAFVNDKAERMSAIFKSIVVFIACSSVFLIPFFEQVKYQKFMQPSIDPLHQTELKLSTLIAESLNNNLNGALSTSGSTYNIGILLLIAILIGLFQYKKWSRFYRVILILGVFITLCSTNLVPWLSLEHTPLSVIQFPWRYLGIASFLLSVIAGKEIVDLSKEINYNNCNLIRIVIVVVFLFIPWFSGIQNFKVQSEAFRSIYTANDNKLKGSLFLDQYTPRDSQKQLVHIRRHKAKINGKYIIIKNISTRPGTIVLSNNRIKGSSNFVLPMVYYKNIRVTDNRGNILTSKRTDDGLIKIKHDNSKFVEVHYLLSKIDDVAIVFSIFSWSMSLLYIFYKNIKI